MPACRVYALLTVALLIFAAGCASPQSARSKPRFRDVPGSFGDLAARDNYIAARVRQLTKRGLSEDAARGRASREWFASAPVASQEPTAYERERRQAQADLDSYLADYRAGARRAQ